MTSPQTVHLLLKSSQTQPAWRTLWLGLALPLIWLGSSSLYLTQQIPAGLAFVANTLTAYFAFTVLHEAVHGNIRAGQRFRRCEKLLGWLSGALLTVPFPVFRHLHLRHHAHTNDPEQDPDYWVAASSIGGVLLKCSSIVLAYYWHFFKTRPRQPKPHEKKYLRHSQWGFLGLYGLTALAGFSAGWKNTLVLWWGPAMLAVAALALAFNWLPHHPHLERSRYRHTRILLYPGLSWLLAAQNYHLIHHLHPGLPFYRYRQAFHLLQPELIAQGATLLSWRQSPDKNLQTGVES